MVNKKKLAFNYLLNILNIIMSLAFPMITFPYVSRVLGSEGIGIVNFAQSYGYYFMHLASFGVSSYAVREISKIRDDKDVLNKKANEIFSINLLFSVISWCAFIIGMMLVPKFREYWIVFFIYSLSILSNFLNIEWVFQSFDDYLFVTIRACGLRVVSLIAVFLLIKEKDDFAIYMAILTLSELGARFSSLGFSNKKYVTLKARKSYLNFKDHFKPMFGLFSFRLVNGVSAQLDKLMIGFMLSYSDVGIYTAGVKFILLLAPIAESIGTVLFPTINIAANSSTEQYKKTLKFNYDMILLLGIPMSVGFFLVSPMVILLFAGEEYIKAIQISRILSIALVLIPVGDMLGSKTLLIFGKDKHLLICSAIVAVCNIVFNAICIPIWGSAGAAMATAACYLVAIIFRYYYTRKIVEIDLLSANILKYFLFSTPFIIIYIIFNARINTQVFCFLIYILSCILIYGAELVVFKDEIATQILRLIMNKYRHIRGE